MESIFDSEMSLYDPWTKLNLNEETSFHKFQKDFKQGKRIDWILASPKFSIENIFLDKEDAFPVFPSDHFPVKAEFRF